MMLVMIQSDDLAHLRPVQTHNLHEKLAAWHISVMPPHLRTLRTYRGTDIPLKHFKPWTMPDMWRIWEPSINNTYPERGNDYPGASTDNTLINSSPAWDAITWSHELALMGVFPDSYRKFLRNIGHKSSDVGRIMRVLALTLRRHLRGSYYAYQALARRAPQHTTSHHTTQQRTTSTRRRAASNTRPRALQDRERHRDDIRRGKQKINHLPMHNRRELTPGTNQAESGPSGFQNAQRPARAPTAWGPGTNAQTPAPSENRDTARGEGSCWWTGRRVRRRIDGPLTAPDTNNHNRAPATETPALPHDLPTLPLTNPLGSWPCIRGLVWSATHFTPVARTVVFLTTFLALLWPSLVSKYGGTNFGNQFRAHLWPLLAIHHGLAFPGCCNMNSDYPE